MTRGNRNDLLNRGDIMDLVHGIRDYTKPASEEYSKIWEGIVSMPGFDAENPQMARAKQDRWATWRYYTKPLAREPTETEKTEGWYKPFMEKRNELMKLEMLDDGQFVFKDWAKQFKGRTFEAIGKEILEAAGKDPDVFFPEGATYQSIRLWIEENGEQHDGPYIGVMEYFATGEGVSKRIIASHAESKAHFLLYCGEKLGGYYFVQGLDVYTSVEEAEQNRTFTQYVPKTAYAMFAKDGHVAVDLNYHVNFS